MNRKLIISSAVALLLCSGQLTAKTYATVNGEPLTDKEVKPMLQMFQGAESVEDLDKDKREMLLDQSIEKMLISQQAKKEKIEESDEYQKVLNTFRARLTVELWMKQKHDMITVSDEELEKHLKDNNSTYPKDATVKDLKDTLTPKVKMEKFQILIDKLLSKMKKEAIIEYK